MKQHTSNPETLSENHLLNTLTVEKLESILAFANKAASITTSRHGAIPAMPTLAEVEG